MNSLRDILETILIDKKRFFGILGIAILAISLPIISIVVREQQKYKQNASGEQTQLFFANQGSTNSVSSFSVNSGGTVSLDLYLNANSIPLSGFDMTITAGSNLTISQIVTSGTDADKFNVPLFAAI